MQRRAVAFTAHLATLSCKQLHAVPARRRLRENEVTNLQAELTAFPLQKRVGLYAAFLSYPRKLLGKT